jgi:hypothetical protein
MPDYTDEQLRAFLIELSELSRKHGLLIGGCGCCGSPYIMRKEDNQEPSGYLTYNSGDLSWISPRKETDWQTFLRHKGDKGYVHGLDLPEQADVT